MNIGRVLRRALGDGRRGAARRRRADAGGYEFNLTLVAAVIALIDAGPGRPSVDESLGLKLQGSGWALAALAAGVGGSAAAIELG
jgi:hypothetical protein